MEQIPIPFLPSNEIFMTAISIVVAIVFQKQIYQSIEDKNGNFLKFVALIFAIIFVFFTSILIFALVNFMMIITSIFTPILNIGNNYGTLLYIIGSFVLIMRPFLGDANNKRCDNLFTTKELVAGVIVFIVGIIYNNYYL